MVMDASNSPHHPSDHCSHFDRRFLQSNSILSEIRLYRDAIKSCHDCRGDPIKRSTRDDRERPIWVCLECNATFCGGLAADCSSPPRGHARRHAKAESHSLAARLGDPPACWCFICDSFVPIPPSSAGGGAPEIEIERRGYRVRGLANLGNTCFFNSVMQNLLAIDVLRDRLATLPDGCCGPLTTELGKLFAEVSARTDMKGVVNPSCLFECVCVKAPQFGGRQQHDSHELLRCLLDELHTEELSTRSNETSQSGATFVDALFGGQLSSTVSCVECGHTSVVYEPFLDLSLPVPLRKPLPKKRSRALSGEGSGGRRRRQKGAAKRSRGSGSHNKAESSSSQSDCGETVALGAEENIVANDHRGSVMLMDGADSVYQKCEVTIAQCSESMQFCQSENVIQHTADSQIGTRSGEFALHYGANSCSDEADSSCVQNSRVPLMPYKEACSDVEKTNGKESCSQIIENLATVDDLIDEMNAQSASFVGCERAEADAVGSGDLLDEPEISSYLKTVAGVAEVIDTTQWIGNGSATSEDKVDDSSSPISIESCLALFTKPELLTDDHAWYCERCSESSPGVPEGHTKLAAFDQSETLKSQLDGKEMKSTNNSRTPEEDRANSAGFEVMGHRKMTELTSKDLPSYLDVLDDANTEVDASTILPSLVEGSVYNTCEYGQARCEKSMESSDHMMDDQARCADILHREGDFAESDSSSQYISCPSNHENPLVQANQDGDSCSVNEANFIEYDGQTSAAAPSSLPDQTETIVQSSCENDSFSEVDQVEKKSYQREKKGLQLLAKVHLADNCGGKKKELKCTKVKRNATKRILINKASPILTVHLKRFSQDAPGRLNKLSGHVSFQEILDLKPYMDPRCGEEKSRYRLMGVVEHLGTMTRGHYVAYVRGEKSRDKAEKGGGSAWFYASDSHVQEASLSEVLRCEAYILFYARI